MNTENNNGGLTAEAILAAHKLNLSKKGPKIKLNKALDHILSKGGVSRIEVADFDVAIKTLTEKRNAAAVYAAQVQNALAAQAMAKANELAAQVTAPVAPVAA